MNSSFRRPPLDGSITVLPGFIDFHAEHNPMNAWAVFPSLDDPEEKTYITYAELAHASHRIAHALRPGRKGPEQQVVAIVVNCDTVFYVTLMVGLRRAGMVPFPMSPKNSPEAIAHMLKTTGSHCIITQSSLEALTSPVKGALEKEGYSVDFVELPAFHDIYPQFGPRNGNGIAAFVPYPPPETPRKGDDLAVFIHSSGSTGLPKSIPWTERVFLLWADSYIIRMSFKYQLRWACMALPTFHSIGMVGQVLTPLMSGLPCALYTPQAPAPPTLPNPKNMMDTAIVTDCNAMAAVPIFIEMWCRSPDAIKYLASLQCLCWAGGPLSQSNGDTLVAAGVNLAIIYGLTETGIVNKVMDLDFSPNPSPDCKKPEDWNWMQFDERVTPRWVDQGDGTSELQILSTETYPMAVENLPDVPGYATNDVFKPHPTQPGLWKIVGRADDVIVLRSGEKVVPLPQEDSLNAVPVISSAIMFGRGQDQPGVVIELMSEHAIDPSDENAVIEVRNKLWPYIEEANKRAPAFARLFKETILIADPKKPFARAAKGTAIRKVVVKQYDPEINDLYTKIQESADAKGVLPPDSWTPQLVEPWLGKHAAAINNGHTLTPYGDLFEQGFDSLSATFMRNRIIGALRNSKDKAIQATAAHIPQEFVYQYPTLSRLSNAIVSLVNPEFKEALSLSPTEEIQALISKYSTDFPEFKPYHSPNAGAVVLVTGSTGGLGSHILASLLANKDVVEVITLNRGTHVAERQAAAFVERNLPTDALTGKKLTSLVGDLKQGTLGLDEQRLQQIRSRVTHIIHTAWRVDFNLALSSFESHVANTRNLINFSASCDNPVRLLFTSSAAAVHEWDVHTGTVPEDVIDNPAVPAASGYGASKYVTEHILARAAKQGLSATSARLGQICGSTTSGDWNISEWFPILLKTSFALGKLPEIPGPVSWIPIDTAAQVVVDVTLSTSAVKQDVVNIVHPRGVPLYEVYTSINGVVGNRMQIVPFEQWVRDIEALSSSTSNHDAEAYPAIKLLMFWKVLLQASVTTPPGSDNVVAEAAGMPVLQTEKSQTFSQTLRTASPIGRTEVELWLKYWQKKGFVSL